MPSQAATIVQGMPKNKRGWWSRRRARIFERDGWACIRCGATDGLTVDHVLARSLGGTDALSNLQTLCGRCNTRKAQIEGKLAIDGMRPIFIDCRIEDCPFCGPRYEGKAVRRV